MKPLYTIQKLSRIGKILSNIAFIFSVIGFCVCIIGVLSLKFGNKSLAKIGCVAIYGLISDEYGYKIEDISSYLIGMLIACAGEALLARFAQSYFKNELEAKTPFTLMPAAICEPPYAGAKEMLRLGILVIVIPIICDALITIADSVNDEKAISFGDESNITLGIMFILGSLLCNYGAQLTKDECDISMKTTQ